MQDNAKVNKIALDVMLVFDRKEPKQEGRPLTA